MEDDKIIALYWARKEEAISETDRKYGSYCRSISFRILNDKEDSEECVNDTWLHTWNDSPRETGISGGISGKNSEKPFDQ